MKTTKLMKACILSARYTLLKKQFPDSLLLFRFADEYVLYRQDAIEAGVLLNLTITRRGNSTYEETGLTYFPVKGSAKYVRKLLNMGRRIIYLPCDKGID